MWLKDDLSKQKARHDKIGTNCKNKISLSLKSFSAH